MWKRLTFGLPLLTLAFLAPVLWNPAGARGADKDEIEEPRYWMQSDRGKCKCSEGHGSWEYLRSPMKPPNDPARCGLLLNKGNCANRPPPKGTSAACWSGSKKECFFKRHAFSHGIDCSVCVTEEKCPSCDKMLGASEKTKATLAKQLKLEGHSSKQKFVLAMTRHFYVITDIDKKMKVKTKGGAPRVMSAHEVAHLYAERCERAFNDFNMYFRGNSQQRGRMGVYIMKRQRTAEAFAEKYLGSARTDMLYGGGTTRVAGGFCFNGFVGSLQESGSDDDLHAYCRHMIGHILFSTWRKVDGKEKSCPKWAFIGSAHFLEKLLEPHRDAVTFCAEESTAPTGSGKDWLKKARSLARRKLDPIETFFARQSMARFAYNDHIRAWALMHLGMIEDNERWVQVLAALRAENDEGFAIKAAYGFTADDFHRRWVDRLTGKRPTMGDIRKDADDPDGPGRRERDRIRKTDELNELAGLIRGVDTVKDVKMAAVIVGRMDHPSEYVRETIQWVLGRTESDEVKEWLRTEGLSHKKKMARAGVARTLGRLGDPMAREALEGMLEDKFWLARANAAFALSMIHDEASLPHLIKALDEKKAKAWMSIADAVAAFGVRSDEATIQTSPYLSHRSWQLRVTAARALKSYGTDKCMSDLIKRYSLEKGRLERELLAALKAVSGDDLGKNASSWEKWWKGELEKHGGFDPNRPPPPSNPEDDKYAEPDKKEEDEPYYYGRRIFSRAVGFVFDVSASMDKNITIPKGASTKLGDIPRTGTRLQVAKEVLAGAIRKLKPGVRFNLVFFSSDVRPWKGGNLIPASGGNVASGASAVMNAPAAGETNIHGALKAALGLHEKSSIDANLDNIPDTVYFLTDGSPTRGEITSAPELLGWFENLNRFAKVRLHVVAFGNLGVDLDFLGKLAKVGGGDFIHVPEE